MWFRMGILAFQNRDKLPYLLAGIVFFLGALFLLPALFLMVFFGGSNNGGDGIQPWVPLIEEKAEQAGLDPALVAAVMLQESGGNPRAISPVGAVGLMQLMPETAAGLGVKDPFNPEQNVTGGSQYLANLLRQFNGDMVLAVAAYNAGPGAVQLYGGVPPYEETQTYVRKVVGYFFEFQKNFRKKKENRKRTANK